MRDDLFEFLAAQEAGRATQEAERPPNEPSVPPKCGQSSTRSKLASARSGNSGMPEWMGDLRLGTRRHTAHLDADFALWKSSVLRPRADEPPAEAPIY
jgi:hypothetical protein